MDAPRLYRGKAVERGAVEPAQHDIACAHVVVRGHDQASGLGQRPFRVVAGDGEWALRFNGLTRYARTNNTVLFNTSPRIGLGFFEGAEYWSGEIAEVLLFDRTLAENERWSVGSYLSSKYNLTAFTPPTPTALSAHAGSS